MRIRYSEIEPESPKSIYSMMEYVKASGIEKSLINIIDIRASQINRCAFCLDMHTQDARSLGESEQRINCISVWNESPFYTKRERAALEFTEALTDLPRNGVSDDLYERVRREFNEHEYVALVMAINVINCWNRLMIASGGTPGNYKNSELAKSNPDFFSK